MTSETPPQGYTLIHVAEMPEMAHLFRDVLSSQGFDVYETDNDSNGLFRTEWGSRIYVRDAQATKATAALDEYRNENQPSA
ncbi:MAG: hypothetical protein RLY93_14930 [Sumerlaeia bacterium]